MRYTYRCPRCGQTVGKISELPAPTCEHRGTPFDAWPLRVMKLVRK